MSLLERAALPPLTADEELALVRRIDAGDPHARHRLALANLRLVASIARGYGRAEDFDDLMSVGVLGLLRAIDGFDASRGLRISTYAVPWITQHCQRHVQRMRSMVTTDAHAPDRRTVHTDARLDAPLGNPDDDANETHLDRLADERAVNPEHAALASSFRRTFARATHHAGLIERDAEMMRRRFLPEPGTRTPPLAELGRAVGLSRERARQVEARAVPAIRAALDRDSSMCAARRLVVDLGARRPRS